MRILAHAGAIASENVTGNSAYVRLLATPDRIKREIAGQDEMAIGFLRYLRKSGYSWPVLTLYKLVVTLDAPLQVVGKGLQYLWRRLRGQRVKAEKSLLAMRGQAYFLLHGLVAFWRA